ncbi:sugar transferase [Hoeflea sp. YIM 152468]|uniref:sugar transferase n=1 Tax=Hoeflea sp. YIM 152468 TaxID=3031759 RepID=UPI0031B8346C
MDLKVVVSGASGNVGRKIVPLLLEENIVPLLVGRDPEKLKALFPRCQAISHPEIDTAAMGYDIFLHLTALNNNVPAAYDEFEKINVDLSVEVCNRAKNAGVGRFVFVSSTHALDDNNQSHYAQSKRAAAKQLAGISGIDVRVLYSPPVIGDSLSGRLRILESLPKAVARSLLVVVAALKATVHAERLVEAIVRPDPGDIDTEKAQLVTDDQDRNRVYGALKRMMDLSAAIFVLVLLWWLMAIVWLLVRLDSPGPGLFKQIRVGRNEQPFLCYKFRTMHLSTPQKGTHEVPVSSVTRLGRFLRRTKLDELPQCINLLKNEMSLVGPRPCLPSQTDLVRERRRRGIFAIKPGITGLAQLNGVDMSDPEKLAKWDRRYLDLRGILLDLRLVIATALGKGGGDRTLV